MLWLTALKEHREGYYSYQEYLNERIEQAQRLFLGAKDFEEVLKIKGRVEALQTLLLEVTAEEREELAARGRESGH